MNPIQSDEIKKQVVCRSCKKETLKKWLSLGMQPLANNLLDSPSKEEKLYPLEVVYCSNCELVQLAHVVNPDLLFKNYLYYSSTSSVFRQHFEDLAKREFAYDRLKFMDLVVDVGSNDGILLKPFKNEGARTVGVEPCVDIANKAATDGIETIPEYFTMDTARKIFHDYGHAKLVTMTNVFAHVDDLSSLLEGVKILIGTSGRFMIEVPYLLEMLKKGTFDLIYHEHLSYFSIASLGRLLLKHGFFIEGLEMVPVHGGSLRVFSRAGNSVQTFGKKDSDLIKKEIFMDFPNNILKKKKEILALFKKVKQQKKKIIGYGAPAKATVMLNYFGIDSKTIDYVIDDALEKQGMYIPGAKIKIVPYGEWINKEVDYIFIFAWNFADSIIENMRKKEYKKEFIVPFPAYRDKIII